MKNIQHRIDESVDEFIGKLQTVVGELAVEVIEQRLTRRRKARRKTDAPHRSPEEISALTEELYAQICQQPGKTMMELSKALGERSQALAVPARTLAKSGRVKKTGIHSYTRYFPVGRQAKLSPKRHQRKQAQH